MAGLSMSGTMGSLALCLVLLLSIVELIHAQTNVPVITDYSALDNQYLSESLPIGYVLGTIRAYDPDGTPVKYSIRDSGGEYFNINEDTGVVTLKKLLDYETDIEIKMTIRVVDGDGQVASRDAKVFVNDENDNAPVFVKTGLSQILREDAAVGFPVAPITVTDRDTNNDFITVTCEGDTAFFRDACDTFELKLTSNSNKNWIGTVLLKKPLDYETRIAYNILLVARDGKHNVSSEVHVEVEDINDAPPRWITTGPKIIPEEEPIGTSIQLVRAVDGDSTNPRNISYSLIGPNTDIFQINNVTGVISNAVRLDYDGGQHQKGVPYDVVIKASEVINPAIGFVGNDNLTTATVSIKITVEDINDNSPTFSEKEYLAYVDENIVSGSNIPGLQMTITDIDSGTFNSFNLTTLDHRNVFGIIPTEDAASSSATLFVIDGQLIDYEVGPREYIINVRAIENKVLTNIHTGSATVTIRVRDVNDMTPEFPTTVYIRNVSETALPNTFIIDLNATDPEAGNFGTQGIRYKLYGNIPPHFQINEVTGVVSVAACNPPGRPGLTPCIDYERKNEYTLTVSATDNLGVNGRTRSVQLIIGVIDENDNQPRIDASYTRYILEGQTTTINPLRIQPIDPDTVGGPLTFAISGNTPDNLWKITPEIFNGRLVGNITANREVFYSDTDRNSGEFDFVVVVEDKKYSTTANVKIIVIDINNNAPEFTSDSYVEQIEETTTGGFFVTKVTATDLDAPTTGNGVVDFYIERGALGKFMITNVTLEGKYWVADVYTSKDATFNYDVQTQYVMPLIARDRGSPEALEGHATLTVNILDINNRNPRIRPSFQTINVLENEPIGTSVYQVTATDPDQQSRLEFYMNATDAIDGTLKAVDKNVFDFGNLFRIERDTGNVIVNAPLDRDVVSRLTNALTVYDTMANPRQTGTGTLLIRILEYNDQAPQFDFPLYEITIDEELNMNSFVASLNCQDEDDKIEGYSLQQVIPRPPPQYFQLIGGSGAMIVNSRIDFEQIEQIELRATCTDTGNPALSNSTRVLVHIRNINDNSPIFEQSPYSTSVMENTVGGRLNVSIRATDLDKGDYGVVRFRLDPNDPNAAFFSIDPITAEITINPSAEFDREKGGFMGFNVIAYDSPLDPTVRRETSVPVYITIQDANDNCPVFSKVEYEGKVPESAEPETDIIDILVTDADEGLNAQVVFEIKPNSGDPPGSETMFGIGRTTGRVMVNANLRDKSGFYHFNVTATDMDGTNPNLQCSTEVPVTVEVQEADNDAPEWIRPPERDFVIYVLEEQYEGMLVYSAKAVDPNTGPNGVVDYYFTVNGNELVSHTPEFRINRVTGVIRAEVVFDREQRDNYFLTLMAKDRGNPAASSEITLTVVILDVDDNDPVFTNANGVVPDLELPQNNQIVDESNTRLPMVLGYCNATDADSPEHSIIHYEILAAQDDVREYVTVDPDDCKISLIKAVDYEKMPTLEFDIYAYNERNNDVVRRERREVNPSIQHVIVRITDSNDSPPAFTQDEYLACVSVDAPFRQTILEVTAIDNDAGDNSNIIYSMKNTNNNFAIDPNLGTIYNIISFRQAGGGRSSYTFEVTASDGLLEDTASVTIFVTSPNNIVKLKVNRPLTDVEPFKQQLINTLVSSSNGDIAFACVDSMRNHMDSGGEETLLATDVFVTAVKDNSGQYTVYPADELVTLIQDEKDKPNSPYDAIYVTNVEEAGESESFILEEDAVLAILIICILLIVLAIILVCVACYCIWRSKQRKKRKVRANRDNFVPVQHETVATSFNPVYHNAGPEPTEEYATVQKVRPTGTPISPVVIPAPEDLQPLPTDEPHNLQPAEPPRPSWEQDEPESPPSTSRWDPNEPEPVIETEIMGDPIPEPEPQPYRPFEPEYEDKIETEVVDDNRVPSPVHSSPPQSPGRSSPPSSPARSSSPRSASSAHDDPPPPPPPIPQPPDYDEDIEVVVADSNRGSPQPSPPPSPPASSHRSSGPPSPRVERLSDD